MLEGVTIEQLRTLRAVAETGSFSAAARRLGRVQAAVSQSIDRLEAQLGLKLFDRTGRVPKLTPRGEAIVSAAARIHDDIEALDALVGDLKRGNETQLSIVIDAMFPATALVDFAQAFARHHPAVELTLFTESLSAVTTMVRDKRAVLGIAGDDAAFTGLERRRVGEIRLVAVASAGHPLTKLAGPIDAAKLSRFVQIVLSERVQQGAEVSADHGIFSPRTWRVADLVTKHELIRGGLGWGHLPEPFVRTDLREGRLVQLSLEVWGDAPPRRALYLVRRRGAALGPVARWVETELSTLCTQTLVDDSTDHTE
jgi:DNA-binding transcriptional LysR family regulator